MTADTVPMTCDSVLFESGNGFVIGCERVRGHAGPHATFDLERLIVWCRDWEYEKVPDEAIAAELGVRYERGRLRHSDGDGCAD